MPAGQPTGTGGVAGTAGNNGTGSGGGYYGATGSSATAGNNILDLNTAGTGADVDAVGSVFGNFRLGPIVVARQSDVTTGDTVERATVRQRKTGRSVKFELTEQTRQAIEDYLRASGKKPGEFLFATRRQGGHCMTTRQYARVVADWIGSIGLDPRLLVRIRQEGQSTVRYLGIEVDDALAIAGQADV